jgi:uncharacterized 2Fe-2S/4Fe-4S cluster protein (DUF4445 family)
MLQTSLIKQINLALAPPSLGNPASDWEKLRTALSPSLNKRSIEITLPALQELGAALRCGDWQVCVSSVDVGETCRVISIEPLVSVQPLLGVAIDLGTTTIVTELVDLLSGRVLHSRMVYNPQRAYGVDVTSRMMFAEKPGGLQALSQSVRMTLIELIEVLCQSYQVDTLAIKILVIAGNTIMQHLLAGVDPSSIRREPYVPATTAFPILSAAEIGLPLLRASTPIYLFPVASGYVGGDVVAGVLATGIVDNEATSILIDIGTNGETVLGNRDYLLACSGSAGSAFEGCGLRWGMPAQPGAIERVWVNDGGQLAYQTVENEPVRGICGSGLIEALGAFLQSGAIDRSGKVNLRSSLTHLIHDCPEVLIAAAQETAFGESLSLRQGDIENLIRDKAALYAGSRILLANAELTFGDIDKIMIAGNFGQSLEVEQAVRIGLLPDIPRDRIHFIGNSSLAGARAVLLSADAWERAHKIASSLTSLELTAEPRYFEEYTAALFLPHTNFAYFPSVS